MIAFNLQYHNKELVFNTCKACKKESVLTGCIGRRNGFGPGGGPGGGGEKACGGGGTGTGDIGEGHLGLGQGIPYGSRLPNMAAAGLPIRGGGDGA